MCFQQGFNWAQDDATSVELSRLAEFAERICPTDWDNVKSVDLSRLVEHTEGIGPTDWDRWFTMCNDAYTAAERLFFVLNPDQYGDREAAAEFWGGHFVDHEVQEFADGALAYLETAAWMQRTPMPPLANQISIVAN